MRGGKVRGLTDMQSKSNTTLRRNKSQRTETVGGENAAERNRFDQFCDYVSQFKGELLC